MRAPVSDRRSWHRPRTVRSRCCNPRGARGALSQSVLLPFLISCINSFSRRGSSELAGYHILFSLTDTGFSP